MSLKKLVLLLIVIFIFAVILVFFYTKEKKAPEHPASETKILSPESVRYIDQNSLRERLD